MARYRVVQWATGNVGQRALRAVLDRDAFDLVGVHAFSPDKVGQDAGALAGIAPVGVLATDDVDALIGTAPDCVLYTPRVIDYDLVARLLRAGINVVTTGDFLTGHTPSKGAGSARGRRRGGRRDVPRHRLRTGVHQRRGGLSVGCMPTRAQREAGRDAGLHRIPSAGGLDGVVRLALFPRCP